MKPRTSHVVAASVATSLCVLAFLVMTHGSTVRAQQSSGITVAVWGFSGNNEISPITGYVRNPVLVRLADGMQLAGIASISEGASHTVALSDDGTVWAWGNNQYGQLGDGTTISRPYPAPVQLADGSALADILALAAGSYHTLALRRDGTVWAWGYNWDGQLGDGTNLNFRINPIQVTTAPSGIVLSSVAAIAAGESHSAVLRFDGTVWVWGRGNGAPPGAPQFDSRTRPAVPVRLSDGSTLTDVVDVAAGANHTMALRRDGSLWTWGSNVSGQLGDGTATNRTFPAPVRLADGSILSGVVAADGALEHTIALRSDRSVVAWGRNDLGQLGDGTTSSSPFPVAVRLADGTALSDVITMSAGGRANAAVRAGGSLWTWGDDHAAQLGDGGISGFRTAADRVRLAEGGFASALAVSVGSSAVVSMGTFTTAAAITPSSIDFGSVAVGSSSTPRSITVTNTGTADLIISNVIPPSNFYFRVTPRTCGAGTLIAPGATCTIDVVFEPLSAGTYLNSVGIATNAPGSPHVVSLTAVATDPIQIDMPSSIFITEGATATISGRVTVAAPQTLVELLADSNYDGTFDQVLAANADGSFTFERTYADNGTYPVVIRARDDLNRVLSRSVNVLVSNVAPSIDVIPAQATTTGSFFQIAGTFTDPGADAWTATINYGDGATGQLAVGPGRSFQTKQPLHGYTAVGLYTASITVSDDEGVTGSRSFTVQVERHPTETNLFVQSIGSRLGQVVRLVGDVRNAIGVSTYTFLDGETVLGTASAEGQNAIYVGTLRPGTHNLTVRYEGSARSAPSTSAVVPYVVTAPAGALRGWGWNNNGQVGDGTFTSHNAPFAVDGLTGEVVAVAGGLMHTVALKSDGTVWTWGGNGNGQLGSGDASQASRPRPAQVPGLSDIVAIAVGSHHSLALKADATVWGWGYNGAGQLGTGTTVDEFGPRLLNLPPVAAIAAGGYHSVALMVDGSVMTWGDNTFGALGVGSDGSTLPFSATPLTIDPGYLAPLVVAIAAGEGHVMALNVSGQVLAWGDNRHGQLGDGSFTNARRPVVVPELTEANVVAIAAGGNHSLALLPDGTVRTWGDNSWGQLGTGDKTDRPSPANVLLANAVGIAAGHDHSAAVTADGTMLSWGRHAEGELGNGLPDITFAVGPILTTAGTITAGAGALNGFAIGPVTTASVQPASLSFGRQRVGTTSAAQSVTITNTGSTPLRIAAHPVGEFRAAYVVYDTCRFIDLMPGQDCVFDVAFQPVDVPTTVQNATLFIAGNTPQPLYLPLTGTATRDDVAPVVAASVFPAPGAAGWHGAAALASSNGAATVTLTAEDAAGGSGIGSITWSAAGAMNRPAVTVAAAAGGNVFSTAIGVADEGVTTLTFDAADREGNRSATQTLFVRIDRTAPEVTLTTPPADSPATYALGQRVIANYACVDPLSGPATCAGPVSSGDPLDTSTAGEKTFTVTATDAAGNTTTATARYVVAKGTAALSARSPVAATVTVGSHPYGVAVNTNTQYVYVTNHGSNTVSVVDGNPQRPTFNTVVATIGGFSAPRGVAVDPVRNRIYVSNYSDGGSVSVVDGDPASSTFHTVLAQRFVDGWASHGIAVNPMTNEIYVGNEVAYDWTAIDGSTLTGQNFGQGSACGPWDVAVNPKTARLYISNSWCGGTLVIDVDPASPTYHARLDIVPFGGLASVDVNPVTNKIYIADANGTTVNVVDGSSDQAVAAVALGGRVFDLAVSSQDGLVYATLPDSRAVAVVDAEPTRATYHTVIGTLPTGGGAAGVAVDPQSGRIYVANADDGTVTVLAPPTITYGTPLEAALLGASSSIAGSFTYAPAPGEMLDAGMHSVTATFTPTDTANYDGGSIDTIVAVRRATPIVTVTGGTYTYDGQAHPAAGAVTGVNGETLGAPAFTYDGAAVPPVGVGTYAVVASFGGNGNYTPASSAGATIVIRPADTTPPTVTITNPSMDAMYPVDSASTADVVVEATDASGVPNLTVNGTAATMTSGTPQAGTWRATMPISLVAGGVVRFDAVATDAAGNTAPATLIVDNDGIPRAMDRDRTTGVDRSDRYSDDFDNGVTAGTLTRNRWTVELSNAAVAGGVHATASGSGTVAIVSACIGPKKQVRLNADGEAADITCDPTTGTITVTAVRAVTRIELREQLTSGLWQQFKMRTGQSMSVGSPAVAGTDNSEPIDSEILQIDGDGNEIVVGGYQLAPGARVDVSATTGADGTVGIRFEALSGTVTVTISGETRTLRQGEQVTLPVTGPVKTAPVITWPAPASIVYGTALGAAQLNASANVPGMFAYTPGAGTILPAGAGQVLSVAFTPADGAQYATAIATVQITVLPGFSVSDVTITEGNSTGATKQATVTVRLTAKSTEWVAIAYTTSDGSARKDVDYFTSPGTVWFAPGVVAQSVAIPIVQDTIGEATESFFVDFTAVINGASSQARAVVTIVNDDSSTQLFTSSADFAAGTIEGGVYLSETDDGEIMLAPQGSEFSGTSLPAGWTSALLAPDGSSFGADGRLIVNGAAVASPAATSSGQTLEFAAIFSASPGERAGFAASSATGAPMAMFVIGSDMELYARSVNGPRSVESLMGGIDWLGKPHRYKIVWTATGAQYYVDGTLMITHGSMAWGSLTMRPSIVDSSTGDGALAVDWLRATPYASAGSYTSAVFDASGTVLWQKLTTTSSVPAGTTATITYRTGDTPVPDATWTPFTAVGTGGAIAGSSRYLQFTIQINSTSSSKTPLIRDVSVVFKQ